MCVTFYMGREDEMELPRDLLHRGSGEGENKVFKRKTFEYVPYFKAFNGSPLPAGGRPCSLMRHARPFMICSLLSFGLLFVDSLLPTVSLLHTHSLAVRAVALASVWCLVSFPGCWVISQVSSKSIPLHCTPPGDTI